MRGSPQKGTGTGRCHSSTGREEADGHSKGCKELGDHSPHPLIEGVLGVFLFPLSISCHPQGTPELLQPLGQLCTPLRAAQRGAALLRHHCRLG